MIYDQSQAQASENTPLMHLMNQIRTGETKSITVGDIYDAALENDGYTILVASLAIMIILPFGALPGVPAIAGAVMCLLYLGVIISSFPPALPKLLSKIRVRRGIAIKIYHFMDDCLSGINRFAKVGRLPTFNSDLSLRLVAILGLIFSLATIIIGFIPFVPTLLMLPVLLFSLGIILKDGLFTMIGYACSVVFLATAFETVI